MYGVPPTMATTPLTVPALKNGQQFPYWVNRVVPSGTPDAGNHRTFIAHYGS